SFCTSRKRRARIRQFSAREICAERRPRRGRWWTRGERDPASGTARRESRHPFLRATDQGEKRRPRDGKENERPRGRGQNRKGSGGDGRLAGGRRKTHNCPTASVEFGEIGNSGYRSRA